MQKRATPEENGCMVGALSLFPNDSITPFVFYAFRL